ncbi:hypothetical protein CXB51_024593 [Gossypium anomalum]|uniref:Retrovirus-related Pol polyprotein from transposon TNT 1-94-like beta-barrel domain-containing protein n=1 Tax=Gossypium anomalum TaxID=47600 RepID=A0A8J5Z3S0_9ROSI|nr:hypothetical protein CXB51_024593 [Gossypium anomalum]
MTITRFEIEKFNGETNFNLWQVRMMAILVQTGLKKEVLMEKTSSALWKRLEILYATKSLANRLVLKQHLFTFRMNEGELLRDHISQFITLLNDLKNVEVHIDDEDQVMLLLCSLPPSYKFFRETLIYGRDKLLFKDVKGHLLSRENLDNEFGLDSKTDRQASVLVASKKRDKRISLQVTPLSWRRNRPWLRENRRSTAESNEEDVAGANLANENGDDFLIVSTSDNSELTSEWILDLGCSFHMCPNREWFSTYSSVEGEVVRMRNDSSSKVIGIGTVKIKMHDGTIRTLSNVRALVLLKGKRTSSLYILEGSIVTDEIGRPSSITELKSTRLERRQLGHRREKGMTISLKRGSLLDTGFEKLRHCVRKNQTRESSLSRLCLGDVEFWKIRANGEAFTKLWMRVASVM